MNLTNINQKVNQLIFWNTSLIILSIILSLCIPWLGGSLRSSEYEKHGLRGIYNPNITEEEKRAENLKGAEISNKYAYIDTLFGIAITALWFFVMSFVVLFVVKIILQFCIIANSFK